MKLKFLVFSALLSVAALGVGCVATVDGHMKAGVPFLKDTIVSRYPRTVAQVITATKTVLTNNGKLTADNTIANTVSAKVDTRNVWVRCVEIEPNITQVSVQARTKSGGADVDLASEINTQIALQLAAGR